jgi:hypothetical protein
LRLRIDFYVVVSIEDLIHAVDIVGILVEGIVISNDHLHLDSHLLKRLEEP